MREPLADAGPTGGRPPFRFSARCRVEVADTDLGGPRPGMPKWRRRGAVLHRQGVVRVARLGHSSHVVEARLERTGERPEHLADARAVIVGVREYLGRPTRMPAAMNGAIAAFEGIGAGA